MGSAVQRLEELLELTMVKAHTRRLKNGKVVQIGQFDRTGAKAAAKSLQQKARPIEAEVTDMMKRMAAYHGTKLDGLSHRLKAQPSLARKINDDMKEKGLDARGAAAGISDAVRYTHVVDTGHYNAAVRNMLSDLEGKGFGLRTKNYWQEGDDYQGINVKLRHTSGMEIEVQFHTPESMEWKEVNHKIYKRFRVSQDARERMKLWIEMVNNARKIPIPEGIQGLPTETLKPFPQLPAITNPF